MKDVEKKEAKKKSFFFEDYTESQIINDNNNLNQIKISLDRVAILFFIFLSLIFIYCIKIFYLSLFQEKNFFSEQKNLTFVNKRADIVDRNGVLLATSLIKDDLVDVISENLNSSELTEEMKPYPDSEIQLD